MINIRKTCNFAPVQYEGDIDGNPFYFRSRWTNWRMTIVVHGANPVTPVNREDVLFERSEEYGEGLFDASCISTNEAEAIINKCILDFQRGNKGDLEDMVAYATKLKDRQERDLKLITTLFPECKPDQEADKDANV